MKKLILVYSSMAAVLFAVPVFSQMQHDAQGMQGMHAQHQENQTEMTHSCQCKVRQGQESNKQVLQNIKTARQSNDAAKMQAALAEAETAIASMDEPPGGALNYGTSPSARSPICKEPGNRLRTLPSIPRFPAM